MRKQLQDLAQWHSVFAWWPVTTIDGRRVWLEQVERRYWGSSWWDDYFHYRVPAQGMARDSAETEGLRSLRTAKPGPKDAPKHGRPKGVA